MRYLPHTPDEIKEMLQVIGVKSIEEFFSSIPDSLRLKGEVNLPPALTEMELRRHLRGLSRRNAHGDEWIHFLGGGAYRHYIPSAVSALINRSEFATSYTPYQPEVSQGTLQALFEYQTMVAEIFGMEIANASNYDGATAAAEAIMMALRLNGRRQVLLARSLHPEYRKVIATYLRHLGLDFKEISYDPQSGEINREELEKHLSDQTSCFIVGYPSFFGILEDFEDISKKLHDHGGLLITATAEPFSLALAKSPGEMGADIAVGEGQSFGNAINFGGPSLGLFATHQKFLRQIPGRLVGETVDKEGKRGYVLTLATREQHIRRERATSNICTNTSLCALAATITLALLGKEGFCEMASANLENAERTKKMLAAIDGIETVFTGTTFNEFVLKISKDPEQILGQLQNEGIFGGLALRQWYPELENGLLVCVTEMNTDNDIEIYKRKLEQLLQ